MNQFTIASVFCIASLIATANASAQQCTNGQCRLNPSPAASITNLFRLPRLLPGRTPAYTGYSNRNVQQNSACVDGRCSLHSVCRDCGCASNGQLCKCGPNCPPHNQSYNQPQNGVSNGPGLRTPGPQFDYRDSAVQTPRPVSGTYRPVSYSRDVEWESDIRSASERSRTTGQPMLIQVTASWCGYCQQMKKETFTNQGLINGINRDFIAVLVDADSNRELVQSMNIKSLPTTLVVLPNLQVVERREGFQSAAQLQDVLAKHMQRAQLDRGAKVAVR